LLGGPADGVYEEAINSILCSLNEVARLAGARQEDIETYLQSDVLEGRLRTLRARLGPDMIAYLMAWSGRVDDVLAELVSELQLANERNLELQLGVARIGDMMAVVKDEGLRADRAEASVAREKLQKRVILASATVFFGRAPQTRLGEATARGTACRVSKTSNNNHDNDNDNDTTTTRHDNDTKNIKAFPVSFQTSDFLLVSQESSRCIQSTLVSTVL